MLSKTAIEKYLKRNTASFDFLKSSNKKQIEEACREIVSDNFFQLPPRLHQKVCFLIGAELEEFLFFLDMGTGKTFLTLNLLRYRKELESKISALIVVPKVVHIESWLTEVKKYASDLTVVGLEGSSEERWEQIQQPADAYIINYAGLVHMATKKGLVGRKTKKSGLVIDNVSLEKLCRKFNFFVADESQKSKNHDSLNYKICSRIAGHCKYRYGLTGTPFGRNPHDLWSQFFMIDRGKTLGPTLGLFREIFFTKKKNYWGGYEFKFKKDMEGKLYEIMKNRSIYYDSKECIDLPRTNFQKIELRFPPQSYDYYKEVLALINGQKPKEIEGSFVKLRQITSGFLNIKDKDSEETITIDFPYNPKLEALMELVGEIPTNSKLLIFYEFNKSGDSISRELSNLKIKHSRLYGGTKDPAKELNRFISHPDYKIFLINNSSGAEGLNLMVANYACFYESPVSPIVRAQALKRIHRMGQESPCFFYDLVMLNSVDEKILAFLKEGRDLFSALLEGKVKL